VLEDHLSGQSVTGVQSHAAGWRGCTGTTKAGASCHAQARKGQDRCWRHPHDTSDPSARARDEGWDRSHWLDLFEWCGMVTMACKLSGISRTTVYEARQRDEEFATAWADVEERTTDRMEREAYRRAVEGHDSPILYKGEIVKDEDGRHVVEREYSDTLLTFLLKARKPATYRDNVSVQHSGPDGGPIVVAPIEIPDTDEYRQRVARIAAQALGVSVAGDDG
jgi:hypothetical protein